MQRFDKTEVDAGYYERIKKNFTNQGKIFSEETIGARKKLYFASKLIATYSATSNLDIGELTKQQFTSFLGMFQKHLYSQFHKNQGLYDVNIEFSGSAREKDYDHWDSMKIGTYFYNVDLSSAYWQMLYKLGYISEKMFLAYKPFDEYKEVKRYCVSFLARDVKMNYMTPDTTNLIKCDTSALKKVYENVRNSLYTTTHAMLEDCAGFLEYNIDGVFVMNTDLEIVWANLKKMGLNYKTTECRKISETDYMYGCKQRKFKNK